MAAWPPERTEAVTRIPAAKLRELVAAYCDARGAAFYCSTGVNMGGHGSLAFWLQECVNALSGNLDRRGGTLVGRGIIDFAKFGVKNGLLVRDDRSRIGDFGSVNDAFPGGVLADEIRTPGAKQVRALFVTGGNPLITMPNANRLRDAFDELELLVVLDVLPTETASLAHYVLPCTSPFQRPDLPFVFPLMLGLQTQPVSAGDASGRAARGRAARRGDHLPRSRARLRQAALRLARRAARARDREGRAHATPSRRAARDSAGSAALAAAARHAARAASSGCSRTSTAGCGPRTRRATSSAARVTTPDDQACSSRPAPLLEAASHLDADFEAERARDGQLKLITKRHVKTHNSWTHNHEEFVTGAGGTNYLYVHPDDAARAGLADGALADVTSATGNGARSGEAAERSHARHAWRCRTAGDTRWRRACRSRAARAASTSTCSPPTAPIASSALSGMAHLTGIPVEVRPAAGPQDPTSWSGLPEA